MAAVIPDHTQRSKQVTIDYSDCHINAYCRYVFRIASSAHPNGPQTLPFRDWFQSEYHCLPGNYIGINHLPRSSAT